MNPNKGNKRELRRSGEEEDGDGKTRGRGEERKIWEGERANGGKRRRGALRMKRVSERREKEEKINYRVGDRRRVMGKKNRGLQHDEEEKEGEKEKKENKEEKEEGAATLIRLLTLFSFFLLLSFHLYN